MPRPLRIPVSATRYDIVRFRGGLDLVTPLLDLPSGRVRDAVNYEQSITGGYTRIAGYERYSGQPAPSAAEYINLTLTLLPGQTIIVGTVVTGATSAATGKVISVTGTAYALTKITGTFVEGETINVSGVAKATLTSFGADIADVSYDSKQKALAANVYRADISAPPGSGPIRGGVLLHGINYVVRDNAGATAAAFWMESSSGWTAVPLGTQLTFTGGSSEYVPGETVTQGGVSAQVRAVALESGSWGGGTAAGRIVLGTVTGGSFASGAIGGGGVATIAAGASAITLLPGGRWEFDLGNFGLGVMAYGADGVNPYAYQFDGVTLSPINPGVSGINPKHPLVHQDHLFLCFNDLLQHSGIGAPFTWTTTAGAAVYRCPGTINALARQPGSQSSGAMSITMDDQTEMLYGTSAADFQKVPFEQSGGGRAYGVQRLGGQTFMYGDTGIMSVAASQTFGNFAPSSLTMNIRPFTQIRRSNCVASLVNREKSQYRVFFGDGYALYATIVNGRMVGTMPIYFRHPMAVAWAGQSPDGVEVAYFGDQNGMVYKLEAGTSQDGEVIDAFLTFVFAGQGNTRVVKRYRGVEFEVQGDGYAEFSVTYELAYGGLEREQGYAPSNVALNLSAATWDSSGLNYDGNVVWDGKSLTPSRCELSGSGENIAIQIASSGDNYAPYTVNSGIVAFSVRKALKS